MRIIVTSDSHRMKRALYEIVEKHLDDADLFINLGDGADDAEDAMLLYPQIKMECVCGNCDFSSVLPLYKTITCAGKKIFFTHGHIFGVKHGYEEIMQKAKEENADICLFGHTHVPYTQYLDGIYYMNPGSVMCSSYGVIDITDKGIMIYPTDL